MNGLEEQTYNAKASYIFWKQLSWCRQATVFKKQHTDLLCFPRTDEAQRTYNSSQTAGVV